MHCRLLLITLVTLAVLLSISQISGAQPAGSTQACDSTSCGKGYTAVLQSNGSCMCVTADCIDIGGCPEPPKAIEDCDSIEGCKPPTLVEP